MEIIEMMEIIEIMETVILLILKTAYRLFHQI
jgi:hypothetical protein